MSAEASCPKTLVEGPRLALKPQVVKPAPLAAPLRKQSGVSKQLFSLKYCNYDNYGVFSSESLNALLPVNETHRRPTMCFCTK